MNAERQKTPLSLQISLARHDPAWVSLLDSEGIAWALHRHGPEGRDRVAVSIAPYGTDHQTRRALLEGIRRGGAAIVEGHLPSLPGGSQRRTIELPYHCQDFSGLSSSDDICRVRIDWIAYDRGWLFRLPFSLNRLWSDRRVGKRHVMVNPDSDVVVFHRQALVVRKNVRRTVTEVLRQAFHQQGLPLVHKWHWPGRARSVFCFRGDMDGGPRRNTQQFLAAVRPFARSVSLFVCAGPYLGKRDLVQAARNEGVEIGNHLFSHYVFPEGATNRRNLLTGHRFLESMGLRPVGLVAPAHFWHRSLYAAMTSLGYRYASCFGLDHDHLPYYPVVRGRVGRVLEMPFHCIGDFLPKFGIPLHSETMRTYLARLISKKYAAGEPMNLYGHPDIPGRMGTAPSLVAFIRERALQHADVWTGQMQDLASWWQRRQAVRCRPALSADGRRLLCRLVENHPDPGGACLSVIGPDGSWRLIPISECQNDGADLSASERLPSLRPPGPTDVGELVHVAKSVTFRERLWDGRVRVKRMARKYFEIYGVDPARQLQHRGDRR